MKVPKARKLPSGSWMMQVMIGGKRISKTFPSEKEAIRWAATVKVDVEEFSPSIRMTVGQAIDRYIESKSNVLSPSTILGYKRQRKNVLQSLMGTSLESLTQERIQIAINELAQNHSPKYVKNAHGLLSAALRVYKPNMVLHTTLPQKQKYDIAIPTTEEINQIAQQIQGKKFELPFLLGAWLGLRTSEIRGLTWDCVKGDTLYIRHAMVDGPDGAELKTTKSYSGNRQLPIPPYLKALIAAHPHTDEYIIHYNRNQLYKCLERVCDKLGIQRYRFHDLRHYQASVMLALGVPDKYAMERMGHASTNMLKNVYQHTMASKEKEVSEQINDFFNANLQMKLQMK